MTAGDTGDGGMPDRLVEIALTNLDQPLFDGAGATKRDLVDYLDAVHARLLPELADRPLSVIRVRPGQRPFMQKNTPKHAPDWLPTHTIWARASRREVRYPLCNDHASLRWLANQRAVEYHPTLFLVSHPDRPTHLVLDLDPPEGAGFGLVVRVAFLVREVLASAGLTGLVKTSGAKGLHVMVPLATTHTDGTAHTDGLDHHSVAAATRALAARVERLDPGLATTAYVKQERAGRVFVDSTRAYGATIAAAYSPRVRPGLPVSCPVSWDDLDRITPEDLTIRTVPRLIGDPWHAGPPAARSLDPELVAEGQAIPVARVQAMHEGRRRARRDGPQDTRP